MKKRRLFTLCLAVIMLIQGLTTVSYAADTYEVTEYFRFIDSNNQRMSSDGSFEYNFYVGVYSEYFTPTDDQIWIWTRTMINDQALGTTYGTSDVDYRYSVTLYKSIIGLTIKTEVGSYYGLSNGMNYQMQFDVDPGSTYVIYICRTTTVNNGSGKYFVGTGKASPVTPQ